MTEKALEVDNLSGGYGDLKVVKEISLDVYEGSANGVTGRNGVGKTTFLKLICGALPLFGGHVRLYGRIINRLPSHSLFQLGISYAPQESIVFDGLTVQENLTLHYSSSNLDRYTYVFKKFPRLKDRLQQKAGTLSGGEKKLLSFSRAVSEPTKLVILDEPTEGVQSDNIILMAQVINEEKVKGRSFLIVDQNITFLEAFSDRVHLFDHGEQTYHTDGPNFRNDIEKRILI